MTKDQTVKERERKRETRSRVLITFVNIYAFLSVNAYVNTRHKMYAVFKKKI